MAKVQRSQSVLMKTGHTIMPYGTKKSETIKRTTDILLVNDAVIRRQVSLYIRLLKLTLYIFIDGCKSQTSWELFIIRINECTACCIQRANTGIPKKVRPLSVCKFRLFYTIALVLSVTNTISAVV